MVVAFATNEVLAVAWSRVALGAEERAMWCAWGDGEDLLVLNGLNRARGMTLVACTRVERIFDNPTMSCIHEGLCVFVARNTDEFQEARQAPVTVIAGGFTVARGSVQREELRVGFAGNAGPTRLW